MDPKSRVLQAWERGFSLRERPEFRPARGCGIMTVTRETPLTLEQTNCKITVCYRNPGKEGFSSGRRERRFDIREEKQSWEDEDNSWDRDNGTWSAGDRAFGHTLGFGKAG